MKIPEIFKIKGSFMGFEITSKDWYIPCKHKLLIKLRENKLMVDFIIFVGDLFSFGKL